MKSAVIIPFPDPTARKNKHPGKREEQKFIDCLFGNYDLFRLLHDTEEKVIALRQSKKNASDEDS